MKYNISMRWPQPKINNQAGFASIIIALVLILVLSLLTVGFAQLMRREQSRALDKQLSNQAYYAAESGVNDAAKAINAGFDIAKPNCQPLPAGSTYPGAKFLEDNSVGNSTNASYPCLTIDPDPHDLEYGSIDNVKATGVEITGADFSDPSTTEAIGALVISWQDSNSSDHTFITDGSHSFKPANEWGATPVLRIALTPLTSGGLDRTNLVNSTYTAFLYPSNSGSASYSYGNGALGGGALAGVIDDGKCSTGSSLYCSVKINNLGQANYVLNMRSIYGESHVQITAYALDGTTKLRIKNAQAVVDSTGKAQNVLRRIQVRIPAHNNYPGPGFDVEAMGGICKLLKLAPQSSSTGCSSANN